MDRRVDETEDTFEGYLTKNLPGMSDGKLCPIRWMLDRIGERWSLYVLMALKDHGALRFSEIAARIAGAVSNRMLSRTLATLEENLLVARRERGAFVLYELTPQGQSLMTPMRSLLEWVVANARDLDRGRRQFGLPPLDLPPGVALDGSD